MLKKKFPFWVSTKSSTQKGTAASADVGPLLCFAALVDHTYEQSDCVTWKMGNDVGPKSEELVRLKL